MFGKYAEIVRQYRLCLNAVWMLISWGSTVLDRHTFSCQSRSWDQNVLSLFLTYVTNTMPRKQVMKPESCGHWPAWASSGEAMTAKGGWMKCWPVRSTSLKSRSWISMDKVIMSLSQRMPGSGSHEHVQESVKPSWSQFRVEDLQPVPRRQCCTTVPLFSFFSDLSDLSRNMWI